MMRFVRVEDADGIALYGIDAEGRPRRLQQTDVGATEDPYLALVAEAQVAGATVSEVASERLEREAAQWTLTELMGSAELPRALMPYRPPEVWGAAFTYERPDGASDLYEQERTATRPVIFFKATPERCVGQYGAIGTRGDSVAMIPEPELGVILSSSGETIGYTIVNDVSSRDLPRLNPLYLCYSKTFTRCASLGPMIAPPEAVPDPTDLDVVCRLHRDGALLWEGKGTTRLLSRTIEEQVAYLRDHNEIPTGTLLATGTAISPPAKTHLREGDLVEIEITGLGRLVNPVVNV